MKAAQGPELRPGDAVFAKMKSYPFWPARVGDEKRPGNKVPVFFYGTHQTAFLEPKDVVPYWPNKEKYGKPYKKGGFQKAMWEIEHDPGVGLKGQKKHWVLKRLERTRPEKKTTGETAVGGGQRKTHKETGQKAIVAKTETLDNKDTPNKNRQTAKTDTPDNKDMHNKNVNRQTRQTPTKTETPENKDTPNKKENRETRQTVAKTETSINKDTPNKNRQTATKTESSINKDTSNKNDNRQTRQTLMKTETPDNKDTSNKNNNRQTRQSMAKTETSINKDTPNKNDNRQTRQSVAKTETSINKDTPNKNDNRQTVAKTDASFGKDTPNKNDDQKNGQTSVDTEMSKGVSEGGQTETGGDEPENRHRMMTNNESQDQKPLPQSHYEATPTPAGPQRGSEAEAPGSPRGSRKRKAQSEEQKDASSVPPAPAGDLQGGCCLSSGEEQEGGGEDGKVLLKRLKTADPEQRRISAEDRQTVLRCLQGLVQADRENRRERQQQEGEEEEEEERKMPECVKKEERKENKVERKSGIKIVTDSVTDSRLHRLLGEIRVSLTVDNPDVAKCVLALDELGRVPVSSQNLQNHRELIDTLRKIRKFGGSEVVMQKASMLYYKFKSVFLDGEAEDEELLSPQFVHALQEEEQQHAASGLGDQQLP
ncbi:PC4 and SFRS1-interacting protein-like isoform X2 [Denticeps clupeoides]|uniref:PC4 and SFRS1-interacting protein-like isoform X2 n=1 Tax=Denticeps clupeoides TaxID=299321 RepID=UPI0010A35B22|nr:PC4 and SFRS1-interacting protein-like isoform X2 [Denticeps clupeoides]